MNLKYKFTLTLLFISFLFLGCKKETLIESNIENNDARDAIILLQYSYWASASKSHNYNNMKDLVIPNSNFDGMTEDAKDSWDSGNETYYEFSNLKVTEYYETSAAVDGRLRLIQGSDPNYNYSGSFMSSVVKNNGRWLLDGMNLSWDGY